MPRAYTRKEHTPHKGKIRRVMSCMIGQKSKTQLCPAARLDGKRALVTGGTGGIGAPLAQELSDRGTEVIVASRKSVPTPPEQTFISLDLADPKSIRKFAQNLQEHLGSEQIDILCANAGIWPHKYSKTPGGHEMAFAVNCFGHHLLIQHLIKSKVLHAQASIVMTTGDIYILEQDCTPHYPYKGRGLKAYCRSKLGNLWQVSELAAAYPDMRVIAVHPGVVSTGLEGPSSGIGGAFKDAIMLTPEQGAQASLIAIAQSDLKSGDYFHNVHGRMMLRDTDPAKDGVKSRQFWDTLQELSKPYLG